MRARIFTGTSISLSPPWRQWESRYSIHAGQNLPDKEFRYLWTVRVTAAVYWSFDQRLKPPHLTLQHRAGVRPNTSSFDLAESCVFSKQSLSPLFCLLPKVALGEAPFIPKLQGQFAEFLQGGSLKRLSLLDSSTCVGLGYGVSKEAILFPEGSYLPMTSLSEIEPDPCQIGSIKHSSGKLVPIGYDFRLFLRDRLTLRGLAFRRNPWTYGEKG